MWWIVFGINITRLVVVDLGISTLMGEVDFSGGSWLSHLFFTSGGSKGFTRHQRISIDYQAILVMKHVVVR